jgi:hypothetical protein
MEVLVASVGACIACGKAPRWFHFLSGGKKSGHLKGAIKQKKPPPQQADYLLVCSSEGLQKPINTSPLLGLSGALSSRREGGWGGTAAGRCSVSDSLELCASISDGVNFPVVL